jgi:dihydrodipicolinate synthase/N-acetylneuraminate lyase
MRKRNAAAPPAGVWSAAPTPLTDKMKVDAVAVRRMVKHHLRLGVKGLFVGGTNGEGPWLPDQERSRLVQLVCESAAGLLPVAAQVTDNSAARILDNITMVAKAGADIAVIAPPFFLLNDKPDQVSKLYLEAIRQSSLPIGIYDRGKAGSVVVPDKVLKELYAEPNVVMIKDSSMDAGRRDIALAARRKRPELRLLNGWEFNCVEYLTAGYDGLLLGGGVFIGHLAGMIMEAASAGDLKAAQRLQSRMNRIMFAVYGGKKITCWLSGEKSLLVELGIFRTWKNYLDYPLTDSCSRAIAQVLERDRDVLLP